MDPRPPIETPDHWLARQRARVEQEAAAEARMTRFSKGVLIVSVLAVVIAVAASVFYAVRLVAGDYSPW